MSIDSWLTLTVISGCFIALIFTRWATDVVLLAGVFVLMFFGVISVDAALSGFAHEGLVTVALLYIVAATLVRTGVVSWMTESLLGRPNNLVTAQLKLMLPVAGMSSVMNNTPVVAMLVPGIATWAKRYNLSASQLMMPLSYAAIVGGLCSLVGTSTNLVLYGMLKDQHPDKLLGLFDIALIGIPCVLITVVFVVLFSRRLLPNKTGGLSRFEDARQYVVEFMLHSNSNLSGKTIEQAGLRNLPGVFLIEIVRDGTLLPAVSPQETLRAGDRLVFAGNVESVVDLQKMSGLVPAENQVFKMESERVDRCMVEAVVSPQFPGLGKSVRDMGFRNRYGAVIIAVSRSGKDIRGKIGDIELKPGDLLLIEAHNEFPRQMQYSKDFLLISELEDSRPPHHEKALPAFLVMLGMVLSVAFGLLSMFKAALLAVGLMILSRCITVHAARQSVDWQVLMVIGASIGLGSAVGETGVASTIAAAIIDLLGSSPYAALAGLFVLTALFSALISNLAAAVLMFPVASASAAVLGVDVTPFVIALMVAASCSFSTPIGYQTNLMVMGPGDYRFTDYMKMGLPLTVIIGVVSVLLIPVFWEF